MISKLSAPVLLSCTYSRNDVRVDIGFKMIMAVCNCNVCPLKNLFSYQCRYKICCLCVDFKTRLVQKMYTFPELISSIM